MGPELPITVTDGEASRRRYQCLFGCRRNHAGVADEQLVFHGTLARATALTRSYFGFEGWPRPFKSPCPTRPSAFCPSSPALLPAESRFCHGVRSCDRARLPELSGPPERMP